MAQLGEMLKGTRERQGLSLDEVEQAIHIRRHLLEALEDNRFKEFASPVIARGLIRNYAKFLNLDPIQALRLYDGNGVVPVKGQRLTPDGIEFMDLSMTPRSFLNWELIIGIGLFFLIVGGGVYLAYDNIVQPTVTATPTKTPLAAGITEESALLLPTTTPLPSSTATPILPTDTPTPIVYSGVQVELVVLQSSWVQILADDIKVFEGILQPGETQSWSGQRRVAIRAGNGGGIEVLVNGISRGLMGAEGQVVDQIWEKVDNPAELTPQPGQTPLPEQTPTLDILSEPPPTSTSAPANEAPRPLESAPDSSGN